MGALIELPGDRANRLLIGVVLQYAERCVSELNVRCAGLRVVDPAQDRLHAFAIV